MPRQADGKGAIAVEKEARLNWGGYTLPLPRQELAFRAAMDLISSLVFAVFRPANPGRVGTPELMGFKGVPAGPPFVCPAAARNRCRADRGALADEHITRTR